MKKGMVLLTFISLFGFIPYDKTLTQKERDFAIQYLEQTRDALLNDVKGLTPAQLNFKPDSTRWSVAQCVEHIALAEASLTYLYNMCLQTPANPSKKDSAKFTDQQIINGLTDRSVKRKAIDRLQPDGKFNSYQAALDSFILKRNQNIEFVRTTQGDLRDHYFQFPSFGYLDDYQIILFMAAHSKRHTLQLEEVKASPGFPKN